MLFISLFLVIIALAFLIYSFLQYLKIKKMRISIGIPKGEIKYIDGIRMIKPKVLYSKRFNLKGRPDLIILKGKEFIPLEDKPEAERVYPEHLMELMAYCLLIEESFGLTPTHGILVLKDGRTEKISFTKKERERLLNTLGEMRGILKENKIPSPPEGEEKCSRCQYYEECRSFTAS